MASIRPNNGTVVHNPQLAGILNTVPMPTAGVMADGSPFTLALNDRLSIGGHGGPDFTISADGAQGPHGAQAGAGQVVVGSGGAAAPAPGAQPLPPGAAASVTPAAPVTPTTAATPVPTADPATATGTVSSAVPVQGFSKTERDQRMVAAVDGAEFSFPSFNSSKKRNTAPDITWGPGWKKVTAGEMFYMEHPNGSKAVPALEYRTNNSPVGKAQAVKVANGWGKKYPDGTILVFDRNEGPYRLDSKGNKHKLPLGTHNFGGVKVRVFEAAVVRTLEPSGEVRVFDSRGNAKLGTSRRTIAEGLGAANAGATAAGSGDAPGKSVDGGGAPGKPGMLVGGGSGLTPEQLTQDIKAMTEVARGILDEIQSGNVDPARLAELQAQLGKLPSGILQAAGAAGTMTSDGPRAPYHADHADPADPTTPPVVAPETELPPAALPVAGGGAAPVSPPVAGVDANAHVRKVAAGERLTLGVTIPSELVGKQARFAQLPQDLQMAIAESLGSNQGGGALQADRLVAFGKDGSASIVEAGDVYLKRQKKLYGAGPGVELVTSMRPGRQPGSSRTASVVAASASTTGGGASTPAGPSPSARGGGAPANVGGGDTVSYPGAHGAQRHKVFAPTTRAQHVDLGGIEGTFTWKTLPQQARNAIKDFLANETGEASAQAWAARPGTGWKFDPNAVVVVEAGLATFPDGLEMLREAAAEPAPVGIGGGSAARPPASGGAGASAEPVGHDATRPPVAAAGGGGTASRPSTPPPAPNIGGGGNGDVHHHH